MWVVVGGRVEEARGRWCGAMGGETVAKRTSRISTIGDRFLETVGSLPNTNYTVQTVDFLGNRFLRRRTKRGLSPCGALFKEMLPALPAFLTPPTPIRICPPPLSFRKGSIVACPLSSWKDLATTPSLARRNWGLMPGLEDAIGSLKVLRPAFLLSMSSRPVGWLARLPCALRRRGCSAFSWSGGGGEPPPPLLFHRPARFPPLPCGPGST